MPSAADKKRSAMVDDSGTGSLKHKKPWRFDLVPMRVVKAVAVHFGRGAAAGYGDRNWEKGQLYSVYLTSALSHIQDFMEGEDYDQDPAMRLENFEDYKNVTERPHHLDAAIWQLMALRDTTMSPELVAEFNLDDRRQARP